MAKKIGLAQVSLVDMNDAIVSGTKPTNPSLGTIWVDESVNPSMMKKWDGNEWIELGELDPDMSVTIESIKKTLGNMANDNMIDFQERQVLKDKINEIIGSVIPNTQSLLPLASTLDISKKGNYAQVRASALKAGVDSEHQSYKDVESKYNQLRTYLNSLSPRVWDLRESSKDATTDVVKDEFRNHWLQYYISIESLIEATTEQLKQNVDDIDVGGRNLVGEFNLREWAQGNTSITRSSVGLSYVVKLEQNKEYILHRKNKDNNNRFRLFFYNIETDNENDLLELNADKIISTNDEEMEIIFNSESYTWVIVYVTNQRDVDDIDKAFIKLERGNKATDYTEAPEDAQNQIEELFGKITQVESRITDEAIINKVTSSERFKIDLKDATDSAINNIEIGDRNYYLNTSENHLVLNSPNEFGTARISGITVSDDFFESAKGSQVTISIMAKSSGYEEGSSPWIGIETTYRVDGVTRYVTLQLRNEINISDEWKRYSNTITLPSNAENLRESVTYLIRDIKGHVELKEPTLVIGNKAGSYQLAPEDLQKYADNIAKAEAALAETQAKAHADGKVTAEERRAINDAEAKLAEAKAHAEKYVNDNTGNLVKNPQVTGSLDGWNSTGTLAQVGADFQGTQIRVLRQTSTSSSTVYSDWFNVDPSKAYEVSMWVRKNAARGIYYVGLHGSSTTSETNNRGFDRITNSDGTLSIADTTNFYFASGTSATTSWVKIVGYIMPSGTIVGTNSEMKNIGQRVGYNAIMYPDTQKIRLRWLNYNNNDISTQMMVALPRVTEVPLNSVGKLSQVEDGLGSITSRVDTAEQKITDSAIVSTVRQSTQYKNDLTGKVSTNEIISAFNQTAEGFLMDGRKIDLNGIVTFGTFNSDVQNRITQGTTANSTVNSNKSTWDRSSNINSNGTFNTSKLSGTITESQVNSTSRDKWNTASTNASSANNKLNSTEFNTVSNNYFFDTTVANGSGGKWYRIAKNTGSRAHGKFILRDTTGSQHGTAVFEAGVNYSNRPYINLSSYGQYGSASAFGKARIVTKSTYDEVYLEVYINNNARAQTLAYWLTDNIQNSGWVGLNWTTGSVPSGYSTFERIIDADNVTQGTVDKWKYGNTTEIDGGAIRTNSVTASQIDVDNLFANTAVINKVKAIDVTAARIVGGILESTNGRTKINLNTGLIQTQNTNFELGGGSDIEFTDTSNRLYFNRGVNGSSGLGVTTSGFVDKFPIAFMGTASTNSFTATDDANFSGFIANRLQRYWEDGIGNSVIGHRFDIRNQTAAFNWGYIFDIQGTYKEMYGMNANTYEYNLGKVTNPFRRIFVHNVLSDNGYIRFRNGYSGYDNQGFTMETTYGSEKHLHFRGTNSNDYWNLGKPGGWRFSYVYLVYQPDVSSDERLKEDIKDSNLGLSFINDIKTKSFKLINNNPKLEDEPTQYGLIAQDLREALIKHNVNIDNINMLSQGSDGMYGVQYSQLITPTIKAVQELNQIVINLRNNFNLTVQENERLVLKVSKLESEINELKNK